MKKIDTYLFAVIICFFSINSLAQNGNYYYNNGIEKYFIDDSTSINIIVADTSDLVAISNGLFDYFSGEAKVSYSDEDDNIIVTYNALPYYNINSIINTVTNNHPEKVKYYSYSKILNGSRIWLRNEVVAKIKSINLIPSAISLINDYSNVSFTVEDTLYLNILCPDESTVISLAQDLFESGLVVFAEPDYYNTYDNYFNDPLFGQQYYLHNTGQIISLQDESTFQCVSGIDLKTMESWSFISSLTDVSSIKVAIVDDGVEDHEDLMLGENSKVLNGFPAINHGRPKPVHYHGQLCAGVVAATPNNGKGIVGIDNNSKIVPIRIQKMVKFYDEYGYPYYESEYMRNSRIARGIRKAWNNYDAEVLNFSWGKIIIESQQIYSAIETALINGRNNKGCVVVVASGNEFKTDSINYLGRIPKTISVGAIKGDGSRCEFSNYSSDLKVVAFGGEAVYAGSLSDPIFYCDIRTLDRTGSNGVDEGNYYYFFGGTSAAAPMVSGVASLMLSVNPNLTSQQVKNIIEQTAQKLPDYTFTPANSIHPNGSWNEQVGYGLVDAHRAVVQAYMFGHSISISGEQLPDLYQQYTYNCNMYRPDLFTFVWSSVNGKFSIESSNGTEVVIRPVSAGEDSVIVCIYNQGRLMFREGKPITVTDPCSIGNLNPVGIGDFHVVNNTTWSGNNRLLLGEAMVDSLVTLTITGTLHCAPSARIIVRPGGKLIVDGGTLTSACEGEMWQGIYVEGHRTQHQTAANQGTVQLINGAVVENALRGVYTGAPGENWHTTGGIVTADSATFRNCAKAVEYLSYADTTYPGFINDNWGSFQNCTFTVDDNNLFAANNTDFLAHVTMWDVKGVSFTRCRFEDVRTQSHTRKTAINTIDAGFKVRTGCDYTVPNPDCNCYITTNTYCSFSGFSTAINAATSGNPYAVTIDGARFSNNVTGVSISGNSHAEVTRCTFNLTDPDLYSIVGLALDSCTGYLVEENTFTRSIKAPESVRYGILVGGSGTDANSLYRNTFERLSQGIRVTGNNGNESTGLQMTCNEFSNNDYGIYVAAKSTICGRQGSPSKGADNTFGGTQTSSFYKVRVPSVVYYYSVGGGHALTNPCNVIDSGIAVANLCGSTICGYNPDIPILPPGPKSPTPQFLSLKAQYENLQADYSRNDYADVLEHADDNTYEAATVAAAENVAQQINAIATELYAQSHTAVRALMSDTLEDVQAVHAWLDATPGLASRYLAVETGFAMVSDIANHLTTAAERDEYDNYVAFQTLKDALSYGNGHVAWPHATDAQVWELVRIADANTGRASLLAKNVLCFFFGICYDDDMEMRVLAATTIPPQAEPQTLTGQQNIIVHPNPTDNVLHVSVTDGEIARVEMFDAFGRNVSVETVHAPSLPSPKTTVNTSALSSGVYILRVTLRDGTVRTKKVVKR